jgi:hypothetical protein
MSLPIHTVTPEWAVDWRGQRACGIDLTLHYAPDWIVRTVRPSTLHRGYPYCVQGDLPDSKDPQFQRFTWFVEDGFWNNPRFDLRNATYVES